jgi:hypothetical protein
MAHQEKHSKVNAAGGITNVFGHRFVLKTGSKSVLADLTPRGLEIVGLRIGDSRRLGRRAEAVGNQSVQA